MPSFRKDLTVQVTHDDASQACRRALGEMQLAIKKDNGIGFVANEKIKMLGFANPAKVEIQISPSPQGTNISVHASNFGIGPLQKEHVKGVAETLLSKLRLYISETSKPGGSSGIAEELARLAKLKEDGFLSEDEFVSAKAKLL